MERYFSRHSLKGAAEIDWDDKQQREQVVVEHRIARLVQLGIRQSRYVGKKKSRWQVVMAAVAANLSLVAGYV
ncbi:MAG TPA: transposase, partial [Candidatus Angelobacter sp.]|nr:transposase [Candidatus Angelobacter sp.]